MPTTTITIKCNLPVDSPEDWGEASAASRPKPGTLKDILEGEFDFVYDYPLRHPAKFVHRLVPGMKVLELLRMAAADYEEIYKREEGLSSIPAGQGGPGVPKRNRSRTNGPYGISMHTLDELFFERVYVDTEMKKVTFEIGS